MLQLYYITTGWLTERGLKYSTTSVYNYSVAKNNVISNSTGTKNYGATVSITYSKGPKPFAVGDNVYYKGPKVAKASTGGLVSMSARNVKIGRYISGRAYPYRLDVNGTPVGWAKASMLEQRTN